MLCKVKSLVLSRELGSHTRVKSLVLSRELGSHTRTEFPISEILGNSCYGVLVKEYRDQCWSPSLFRMMELSTLLWSSLDTGMHSSSCPLALPIGSSETSYYRDILCLVQDVPEE